MFFNVQVYKTFIEEYDGVDNGIARYDGEPKYSISSTVSARVQNLNIKWYDTDRSDAAEMTKFTAAMEMIETEFKDKLSFLTKGWLPARAIVKSAIHKRYEYDDHGRIIEFSQSIPWKSHLFELEEEYEIMDQILYVIYSSNPNQWILQVCPKTTTKFFNLLLDRTESWYSIFNAKRFTRNVAWRTR